MLLFHGNNSCSLAIKYLLVYLLVNRLKNEIRYIEVLSPAATRINFQGKKLSPFPASAQLILPSMSLFYTIGLIK